MLLLIEGMTLLFLIGEVLMTILRPEIRHSHYSDDAVIPNRSFLELTLTAVKDQPGLIHGKFENGGVCALGALKHYIVKTRTPFSRGICIDTKIAEQLQEINDSVPSATCEQ